MDNGVDVKTFQQHENVSPDYVLTVPSKFCPCYGGGGSNHMEDAIDLVCSRTDVLNKEGKLLIIQCLIIYLCDM